MRIQVEIPKERVEDIKRLMGIGKLRTYYELFNTALSILAWAAEEAMMGRSIVSLCEETGKTRHLVTPFLQEAAKQFIPETKAEQARAAKAAKAQTHHG
jgi:hypothetical protein